VAIQSSQSGAYAQTAPHSKKTAPASSSTNTTLGQYRFDTQMTL